MNYFDIHSHINISPLREVEESIVDKLRQEDIQTTTVGVDYETSVYAVMLAQKYPDTLWATVGKHPCDNREEQFIYEQYKALAIEPKVIAIGECGLDYYRLPDSIDEQEKIKQEQKSLFLEHIRLAQEVKKPLMIHARPSKGSVDAYLDVLDILENIENPPKANFHFFVGDISIAKRILAFGGTMSFDGPITFTSEYDEVLSYIPIESLMCETDAPFAAPAPFRGKTCEPWMVQEVYKKVADIKQLPLDVVREKIRTNITRIFSI